MAKLRITPEQSSIIKDLQVSFSFIHTNSELQPAYPGEKPRKGRAEPGEEVKCLMIDSLQNKPIRGAVSSSEQKAFDLVLAKAVGVARPMTPAEANVALRESEAENARLRNMLGQEESERKDLPPDTSISSIVQEQIGPRRESAEDIVARLEALELSVPPGDKRSGAWREKALERLQMANAQESVTV